MSGSRPRPDRRRFLLAGAAAGGAALGASRAVEGLGTLARPRRRRAPAAHNVIFMVADGMSAGTLTLGDMMCRARHGRPSNWVRLWERPGARRASCSTAAADSPVTDSAASASAWSLGRRVNNGSLCVTPEGGEPAPILVRARAADKATGLVTTTRITHATPAAFIANVPDRGREDDVARQMLERGVDVALGGGARHFAPERLAAQRGLRVVRTRDELLGLDAAPGPVLGLFARSHMPYTLDRSESEPTLAEMARAALERLERHGGGFIVQIEGGRVDQAAHNNDAGAMVADQLAFDEAIGVAMEFVEGRDDTLLIVTSDHGTANPGLTFYGPDGQRRFERLGAVKRSFEWIAKRAADRGGAADLPALVAQATGVELSERERGFLSRMAAGERVDPFGPANGTMPVLGSLLANHLGVGFASPNHTSDYVEVTALGPGAERLAPMIANTDLHDLVVAAMDLAPAAG